MIVLKDPKKEAHTIQDFLKNSIVARKFSYAIIACSGGIDSTTSLYLTTNALGRENIYTLTLPYGTLSKTASHDAQQAINALRIPTSHQIKINIKPMVDAFAKTLSIPKTSSRTIDQIRLGNVMARCRMITLFDQAKRHHALVIGTENKSELYLGYFTRFGDEASDIEPIRHLYKTEIYQLARYLKISDEIIRKAPSANLWYGQTDEDQFGFTYNDADEILYLLYDEKKSQEEIIKKDFDKKTIEKVQRWVDTNHFKHELPILLKS